MCDSGNGAANYDIYVTQGTDIGGYSKCLDANSRNLHVFESGEVTDETFVVGMAFKYNNETAIQGHTNTDQIIAWIDTAGNPFVHDVYSSGDAAHGGNCSSYGLCTKIDAYSFFFFDREFELLLVDFLLTCVCVYLHSVVTLVELMM